MMLPRGGEAGQRVAVPTLPESGTALDPPFAFDGPPPPVAPATVARDEAGRATIRAVRLSAPIRLDGQLDEQVYQAVPPISDFLQTEPRAGEPATQKTEVWVLFDDAHVYVTVKLWESHPERMILNEMRRDNAALYRNDHIDVRLRHVLRSAQRRPAVDDADRRPGRRADHQRATVPHRLEPGVGGRDRPLRRRLDHRIRDPVQVAALSARPRADLGLQRAAREPVEERDVDAGADAGGARIARRHAVLARADAGGPGGAAGLEEPGHQAVRSPRI